MDLCKDHDRLWSDHFWLTREVIKDAVYSLPTLAADVEALYTNQYDLASVFALIVENGDVRDDLYSTLHEHIGIAIEIVTKSIKGDSVTESVAKWKDNGRKVASLYTECGVGSKIEEMMLTHLTTTLAEATAIIKKDHKLSVIEGERALDHIHDMSLFINSYFNKCGCGEGCECNM